MTSFSLLIGVWHELLPDRDIVMARRIVERVRARPDRTMFFGVGCLHLPGRGGVLDQLEKAGFAATRLSGADEPLAGSR